MNTYTNTASLQNIQNDFYKLQKTWLKQKGTKKGFAEWFVAQMLK